MKTNRLVSSLKDLDNPRARLVDSLVRWLTHPAPHSTPKDKPIEALTDEELDRRHPVI